MYDYVIMYRHCVSYRPEGDECPYTVNKGYNSVNSRLYRRNYMHYITDNTIQTHTFRRESKEGDHRH